MKTSTAVEPSESLDGGRSGIARRRADNGDPLAAPGQRRLEKLADELHGEILERQRRPMEQLQQEMVRPKLHQRRPGGVAERPA